MYATKTLVVALFVLVGNSERTIGQDPPRRALIEHALVSLEEDIDVSAEASGKLTMVEVREGDPR